MQIFFRLTVLILSLVTLPYVYAAPTPEVTQLQAILKKQFPELPSVEIVPSPIAGLYQATAGSHVFYVSKEGRYIVSGEVIDLQQSQKNLTEETRKKARLHALKSLSDNYAIVFSPKNPQYTITVFTDVDCGYCKKLQSEIKQLNALGIAVRYLAFPRQGPQSATFHKMQKIWCAKDKKLAMEKAMDGSDQEIPQNPACTQDVLLKQLEMGMAIGLSGTPTILFEDGTLLPGYLPPEKLLEAVKKIRERTH
jgi:thiol:disulfide interchange protein DsbC